MRGYICCQVSCIFVVRFREKEHIMIEVRMDEKKELIST